MSATACLGSIPRMASSTRAQIGTPPIGRVNARISYTITPIDDADPGERTHASGRLDIILHALFQKWRASEIQDVRIHVGDVIVPADATDEIFEAMQRAFEDG